MIRRGRAAWSRALMAGGIVSMLTSGCSSGLRRPVTSVDAVTDARGIQRVAIDMHSFYFRPNRVVVHAGRPVELILRNRALLVPHNFTIADSAISVSADKWGPGAAHVRFTPTVAGEYRFFCHVDGHSKKGMTGTLVVEP
jgi:plastocyanin